MGEDEQARKECEEALRALAGAKDAVKRAKEERNEAAAALGFVVTTEGVIAGIVVALAKKVVTKALPVVGWISVLVDAFLVGVLISKQQILGDARDVMSKAKADVRKKCPIEQYPENMWDEE